MVLDPHTQFFVAALLAATLAAYFLYTWRKRGNVAPFVWWGSVYVCQCVAWVLLYLRGALPDSVSIGVSVGCLIAATGLMWGAARSFEGRSTSAFAWLAGAVIWIAAWQIPGFHESSLSRITLSSLMFVTYVWLAAWEFWRGRGEHLVSRWMAIVVLSAHGAFAWLRILAAYSWFIPAGVQGTTATPWYILVAMEDLIFTVTMALTYVAMIRERLELRQLAASLIDPLTGIANRRGLREAALRRAARCAEGNSSIAVLAFDLDHFKVVNDRFGHALGDCVLRIFAETAIRELRPTDFVGRLGGEEFVAIVQCDDLDVAVIAAERVRAAFAAAALVVNGRTVGATVSAGVALSAVAGCDVDRLLELADRALYRAKANGRNRVETADVNEPWAPLQPSLPGGIFAEQLPAGETVARPKILN